MLYRILTENKPDTIMKLCSIVTGRFKDFIVTFVDGYRQGEATSIVIFEIDSDCDVGLVRNLAADIREANQQECVIVQVILNTFTYRIAGDINGEPQQKQRTDDYKFKKGLAP